ncbi:hypothetical protein [Lihuaxuella thermophila]|uniref:Uncharacterized protein n=1 Tax=Lihuaxuella thermophila TaxID=1173111 RepID=A0A1H8CRW7_9BACL|nr:hypothetical protein [Lihuaxuella thermophila]SEM97194.1 hypothetical protein SAMN05444955_10455 [Lihuaxuella thermophila]
MKVNQMMKLERSDDGETEKKKAKAQKIALVDLSTLRITIINDSRLKY